LDIKGGNDEGDVRTEHLAFPAIQKQHGNRLRDWYDGADVDSSVLAGADRITHFLVWFARQLDCLSVA
jgi:hypothetical protein